MTLAFHMPEGKNLVFPLETLLQSLTACGGAVNSLNPVIGKVKAGKIVQEKSRILFVDASGVFHCV